MADLPTRALGDSGLEVTVAGLGCNNFGRRLDLGGTRAVVDAALATPEQIERLEQYARERDLTLPDVAIGALLARSPVTSVIAGATKPEQVRANAAAATAWSPSPKDLNALSGLLG